jgi:hypothetical protein
MKSLAELVGGIGVDIMVFRHALEKELEAAVRLLNSGTQSLDVLQKRLSSGEIAKTLFQRIDARLAKDHLHGELAKGTASPEKLGKMIGEEIGAQLAAEIAAEMHFEEIEEHLRKAREQLPAFEAWLSGKPSPTRATSGGPLRDYGTGFMVATKGGTQSGETLAELPMQHKEPLIDPTKHAADSFLARRFQGRQQP